MSNNQTRPGQTHGVGRDPSWKVMLFLGTLTIVIGVILTFSLFTAALVITVLIGLAFISAGIERIVHSKDTRHRALAVVVGLVGIVVGVIALVSPGLTLSAVALFVGIGFIVAGVAGIALGSVASGREGRVWLIATGVLDVAVGVGALAWPGPTIIVVCLLFGIRTIAAGLMDVSHALAVRRSAGTDAAPAVPALAH